MAPARPGAMRRFILFHLFLLSMSPSMTARELVMVGNHPSNYLDGMSQRSEKEPATPDGVCKPCDCPSEVNCPPDVNIILDGCRCCYMCGRQQGDRCNVREKCDEGKGLRCDTSFKNERSDHGVCRAQSAKPCIVNGRLYKDGQQFRPNCHTMCSCQNGNYGCVSLCPQEKRKPKSCPAARLVGVSGKCCKEWACPRKKIHKYHRFQGDQQSSHQERTLQNYKTKCVLRTTSWSACSTSCDFGISVRTTNDNRDCKTTSQVRLCVIRPCNWTRLHRKFTNRRCKPTIKTTEFIRFTYNGCQTVKRYKPKYCSACKARKCCIPEFVKIKPMAFKCLGGMKQFHNFMWIKKCKCHNC